MNPDTQRRLRDAWERVRAAERILESARGGTDDLQTLAMIDQSLASLDHIGKSIFLAVALSEIPNPGEAQP